MTPAYVLDPAELRAIVMEAVKEAMEARRPADELLTTEQAAAELDVVPKTIRRRIREGSLRAERVGSRWRIRRSALAGTTRTAAELLRTLPSGG